MGLYAEPKIAKQEWFIEHMEERLLPTWESCPTDCLPVFFMQSPFPALGVAYNRAEFLRLQFGRPDAICRPVRKSELLLVVPGAGKMKEFK